MINIKANVALICILIAEVLQGVGVTTQYWIQIKGRLVDGGPENVFQIVTTYYLGLFRLCYKVTNDNQTCRKYPNLGWSWWTAAQALLLLGFALLVVSGLMVVLSIIVRKCKTRCFQLFTASSLVLTALVIAGGCSAIGVGVQELDVEGEKRMDTSVYLSIGCLVLSAVAAIFLFTAQPMQLYEEQRRHGRTHMRGKTWASRGYAPYSSGVRTRTVSHPFTARTRPRRPNSRASGRNPRTHQPFTYQSRSHYSATHRSGTRYPGTHRSGTRYPGTHRPGTHRPGTHHPGTYRPTSQYLGTHRPGTYRSGTGSAHTPGTHKSVADGYQRHGTSGGVRPFTGRGSRLRRAASSGTSRYNGVTAGYNRHTPAFSAPRRMIRGRSAATVHNRVY